MVAGTLYISPSGLYYIPRHLLTLITFSSGVYYILFPYIRTAPLLLLLLLLAQLISGICDAAWCPTNGYIEKANPAATQDLYGYYRVPGPQDLHTSWTTPLHRPASLGTELKWLTWLLSGHSPLAYFQHISGKYPSPDCPHCPGYAETSAHFLAECTEFATLRLKHFGVVITTVEQFLSFNTNKILSYIEESDRLSENLIFK